MAIAEVTEAYERLHVTVSLDPLRGAADQFRFRVPEGFQIVEVRSPTLSRWNVERGSEGGLELTVHLREATTERMVLNILGERTGPRPERWQWPQLAALDVAGQATVAGLLVEARLQTENLEASRMIPIDTPILRDALPESVFRSDPAAPPLVPVAAYYAPTNAYRGSARFTRPAARRYATLRLNLEILPQSQRLQGEISLASIHDPMFDFSATLPATWRVSEWTLADGTPLEWERYEDPDDAGEVAADPPPRPIPMPLARYRVGLGRPIGPGEQRAVRFVAEQVPAEWHAAWEETVVRFPEVVILEMSDQQGTLRVVGDRDFVVEADQIADLIPVEGVARGLAFDYQEGSYTLVLGIRRAKPRLTARTFSFFRIGREQLTGHYQLDYTIEAAGTRSLEFSLPASTPSEVAIAGLAGTVVSGYTSRLEGDRRVWTVELGQLQRGIARLTVDFEQRLGSGVASGVAAGVAADEPPSDGGQPIDLTLPTVRAVGVAYQSGLISLEGHAELDVELEGEYPRRVDIGELAEAEYQPQQHLLGAFATSGDDDRLAVRVSRPEMSGLATAIVQRRG